MPRLTCGMYGKAGAVTFRRSAVDERNAWSFVSSNHVTMRSLQRGRAYSLVHGYRVEVVLQFTESPYTPFYLTMDHGGRNEPTQDCALLRDCVARHWVGLDDSWRSLLSVVR